MESLISLVLFLNMLDPEVLTQIDKMGSNEWREREKASAALAKMDERAIPLLRMAVSYNTDAEIRARARRLVSRYENSLRPSDKDAKMPWIECLPKDWPDRDKLIEKTHGELDHPPWCEGYTGEDPVACRYATHDLVVELSRKGWSRKQVVKILDDMVENEKQWEMQGGRYSMPPEFNK